MPDPNAGIRDLLRDLASAGATLDQQLAERDRHRHALDEFWSRIDANRRKLSTEAEKTPQSAPQPPETASESAI